MKDRTYFREVHVGGRHVTLIQLIEVEYKPWIFGIVRQKERVIGSVIKTFYTESDKANRDMLMKAASS